MSRTTPTAATFRDPLLRVLGTLSGLTAGTEVATDTAVAQVCVDTGIPEDAHGLDKGTGRPQVRIWIIQAFNRKLRDDGLAEVKVRGHWTLTEDGIKAATLLLGGTLPASTPAVLPAVVAPVVVPEPVVVVAPATLPEPEPVVVPLPVVPTHGGGSGASWSLGQQVNTYNEDPYIRGLAVNQTKCFGRFSGRSDVCSACPLSGACKGETMSIMTRVVAAIRVQDEAKRKAALAPTPVATPVAGQKAEEELDISDVLAAIENNTGAPATPGKRPEYTTLKVAVDSKCAACSQKVPAGTEGYWARTEGVYHPECYNKKYPV